MECINCGKIFEAKRSDAKYCSANCRVHYLRKVKDPGELQKAEKSPAEVLEKTEPKTKLVVEKTGLKEKPSDAWMEKVRQSNEELNKVYGEGTIMFFGDKPEKNYDVISTGSMTLDEALGIGGLPRGRIIEIYGFESCGKTTIALHVISKAQQRALKCMYVDAENAFDPEYAMNLGIDVDKLMYVQPDYGEQALEVVDKNIINGDVDVVVVDSVAALIPKAELAGEMGDSKMGLHARLMSQACRKMATSISKRNVLLIFINQLRYKIGTMFQNPEVTTGGMALQFYASIRLRVDRSISEKNSITSNGIKYGNLTTVKVIKNKCSPPFKTASFNIIYGQGIDKADEIFTLCVEKNIIIKSGGWYKYDESIIGNGREMAVNTLNSNPELMVELEKKIFSSDPVQK